MSSADDPCSLEPTLLSLSPNHQDFHSTSLLCPSPLHLSASNSNIHSLPSPLHYPSSTLSSPISPCSSISLSPSGSSRTISSLCLSPAGLRRRHPCLSEMTSPPSADYVLPSPPAQRPPTSPETARPKFANGLTINSLVSSGMTTIMSTLALPRRTSSPLSNSPGSPGSFEDIWGDHYFGEVIWHPVDDFPLC